MKKFLMSALLTAMMVLPTMSTQAAVQIEDNGKQIVVETYCRGGGYCVRNGDGYYCGGNYFDGEGGYCCGGGYYSNAGR